MPLIVNIDNLMMAEDPFGANSALVADYFTVNDTLIDLDNDVPFVISFCIEEASVLKFELAVNFSEDPLFLDAEVAGALIIFGINGEMLAFSEFNDNDTPSSGSLRY